MVVRSGDEQSPCLLLRDPQTRAGTRSRSPDSSPTQHNPAAGRWLTEELRLLKLLPVTKTRRHDQFFKALPPGLAKHAFGSDRDDSLDVLGQLDQVALGQQADTAGDCHDLQRQVVVFERKRQREHSRQVSSQRFGPAAGSVSGSRM